MKLGYIFFVSMMLSVSLNAMHDEDEWLRKADEAFAKTEGVQQVKEEKDAGHEAQEKFETLEQSPEVTQEDYDEPTFDENDHATWFTECPAQGQPLTCDYFKRKKYFQRAVSLTQEQKNNELDDSCAEYSTQRCKIGGWVCAGANPNISFKRPWRPLLDPLQNDDFWLVKILLEHKAKPNKNIILGEPALSYAKNKEIAELLVAHGAKVNWKGAKSGNTLLHRAIMQGRLPDLLEYYIEQKVFINSLNHYNETALHELSYWCTVQSRGDVIKKARLLFKAGIDIDIDANKDGKTAQGMLQECRKNNDNCRALYDLIEEERNNRLKQLQKNGGEHGTHV